MVFRCSNDVCALFTLTLSFPSENAVVQYYRMMQNLSRGEAIIKYLEIIQSLPMFAMHYFEVKVCVCVCVCVCVYNHLYHILQ